MVVEDEVEEDKVEEDEVVVVVEGGRRKVLAARRHTNSLPSLYWMGKILRICLIRPTPPKVTLVIPDSSQKPRPIKWSSIAELYQLPKTRRRPPVTGAHNLPPPRKQS